MILRLKIRSWPLWLWMNIIHVVVKIFAKDACTPSVSLVTLASVRFAIPTEVTKQMKTVPKIIRSGRLQMIPLRFVRCAGFQQDHAKAIELYGRAAELGCSKAHGSLGDIYDEGGDMKKAKFHYEAAAMAGDEVSRHNIGLMEYKSGNMERAIKHWTIAASAGNYKSMYNLLVALEKGYVSRESIESTLAAYNSSCAEFRSEARDAYIQYKTEAI
jgi:TPR repeat protein